MKNKSYELDDFIFFLSPAERRNALLLSRLFKHGKVSELISNPKSCSGVEARAKWQVLEVVGRSRSYFHPTDQEKALSLFRSARELKLQGYNELCAKVKKDAIDLCITNELFEVLLAETNINEDGDLQDLAWRCLSEIRELQTIAQHVKKWMRHPDRSQREMALAPLLEGKLSQYPTTKRGNYLYTGARFRVLIFLGRYHEALDEANTILKIGGLDERESLQLIAAAINLRLSLGLDIDLDLARFWAISPFSKEVAALRMIEFCQIEWLVFAVRGDDSPGLRAYNMLLKLDSNEVSRSDDALFGMSIFWGLHWAFLTRRRIELEDLIQLLGDRISDNPKCFEWALIAIICHLTLENDVGEIDLYARLLRQAKTTLTSATVLRMIQIGRQQNKAALLKFLRFEAPNQPNRERNYLDLTDFLQILEKNEPIAPRRTKTEDGSKSAILM